MEPVLDASASSPLGSSLSRLGILAANESSDEATSDMDRSERIDSSADRGNAALVCSDNHGGVSSTASSSLSFTCSVLSTWLSSLTISGEFAGDVALDRAPIESWSSVTCAASVSFNVGVTASSTPSQLSSEVIVPAVICEPCSTGVKLGDGRMFSSSRGVEVAWVGVLTWI